MEIPIANLRTNRKNIGGKIVQGKMGSHNRKFTIIKKSKVNQLLVGLVMIVTDFGRKDHSLIPYNCDRRELEPLDVTTLYIFLLHFQQPPGKKEKSFMRVFIQIQYQV
jgi:hypothetical protein